MVTNAHQDDEVTSVVDTSSRAVASDATGDDVIQVTSMRPANGGDHAPHDTNAPAVADQDLRVRLMARGSRDALRSARERLVQRRTPQRPGIAPDPATQADQAFGHDTPTSTTGTREDTFRNTPPVPRDEVDAGRKALSPASGVDSRFDTVPELKPDVDLPRLRDFLRNSGPTADQERDAGPSPSASSYDMVLKRAQEIRAEVGQAREQRPVRPQGQVQPPPEPPAEPEPLVETRDQSVVWDLAPTSLNVAFARDAIAGHPDAGADPAFDDDDLLYAEVDVDADEAVDFDPPFEPLDLFDDEQMEASGEFLPDDGDVQLGTPAQPARQAESPRGSWWRSLNFGRKRRVQAQATAVEWDESGDIASWDEDDAWDDAVEWQATVTADGFDVPSDGIDEQEDWDEGVEDDLAAWDDAEPMFDESIAAAAPMHVSSAASWLEDERLFPEPQPASWHDERSRLLARREDPALDPGPARPLVEEQPVRVSEVGPPSPVRREPASYFPIDQPSGMDAFRAALFGDDHAPAAQNTYEAPAREARHRAMPVGGDRPARVTTAFIDDDRPAPRAERTQHEPDWRDASRDRSRKAFDDIAVPEELPVQTFAVASGVTRACGTCRSFRPAEDGQHGWCMNDWASTHRQMVTAGELACRSSIGDWWAVNDNSWIPPVDSIRPETPRTDRLEARVRARDEAPPSRDARVRTRKVI